ncbi:DUF1559 family PulG-like putative transporter [Gimesia panareensis]|uniref:DUF1559 domain-containing protein n=1 Tax=Gimesia panareensis TaxID=2527978 RepID=A0A518AE85_9PLAN|nr:DUF1559 domain-containing protein [Gimesia panareensis]QDT29948.1 hypothetical protein Enr10x_53060 [Gimesia panareensis]QDU53031.1 hypothetical protein Pan110_54140 [Gimesia panareensis]
MKQQLKSCSRRGASVVELIVVIVIACLLVAVVLPAIPRSRRPARKLSCLNNMRNIGLAVVNYSSGADSHLPLLVEPGMDRSLVTVPHPNMGNDDLNWCITVLPFLDSVAFRQKWDQVAPLAAQFGASAEQLKAQADLKKTVFPVFNCPDDPHNKEPGALSYVVNVGYVTSNYNTAGDKTHRPDSADGGLDGDITTTEDIPVKFGSGVFWRPYSTRMSLDIISAGDGLTQTLMLSENLQAGDWSDTDTGSLGFGIDIQGVYPSGSTSLALPANFDLVNATTANDSRIGANPSAAKRKAWRPSSDHPRGAVNVIFCDGSGRSFSPNMDPGIYARLLTPQGLHYGQDPIFESDF